MSTQEGDLGASTPPYIAITGKQVAQDPSVYEEISAPWELMATPSVAAPLLITRPT